MSVNNNINQIINFEGHSIADFNSLFTSDVSNYLSQLSPDYNIYLCSMRLPIDDTPDDEIIECFKDFIKSLINQN